MYLFFGSALLCFAVCIPMHLYYRRRLNPLLSAVFKALATVCALAVALVGAVRLNPLAWICVLSLGLCAASDFVLEYLFLYGYGLKILSCIGFLVYFSRVLPVVPSLVVCSLIFVLFFALFLYRSRSQALKQLPVFILYALSLSLASAFALGGGFSLHSAAGVVAGIGGALLYIGGFLLTWHILYPSGKHTEWMSLSISAAAMLMISYASFLMN